MIALEGLVMDELRAHGFASAVADLRARPSVFSAVLLDASRARVLLPPFRLENGLLVEAGDAISRSEFDELVEEGSATALPGAPARSDGCFFFPAGRGSAEYTSLTVAASRLREFAETKVAQGDRFLDDGRRDDALEAYALAAATSQAPDDYARMLVLLPKSSPRRARIEEALARVAQLGPPSRHVDRVLIELQRRRFPSVIAHSLSNARPHPPQPTAARNRSSTSPTYPVKISRKALEASVRERPNPSSKDAA